MESNYNILFEREEKFKYKENIYSFCTGMYSYFLNKGYYTSLLKYVGEILMNLFSLFLFFITTIVIDWMSMFSNGNIILSFPNTSNKYYQALILSCFSIYSLHFLYTSYHIFSKILSLSRYRNNYNKILLINDENLKFMKWGIISESIIKSFPEYEIQSSLEITQLITRKDNYRTYILDIILSKYPNLHLTNNFINIIDILLTNNIIDNNNKLNTYYLDIIIIKFFTTLLIIVSFIFIPVRFFYHFILFLLKNIEMLYSERTTSMNKKKLIPYSYTLYNELEHLRINRMTKAEHLFHNWSEKNPNLLLEIVLKFVINCLSFVMSIFILILICYNYSNAAIWYITCLGSVLYFIRNNLQTIRKNITFSHSKIYKKLRKYLPLFRDERDARNERDEKNSISSFYHNTANNHVFKIKEDIYNLFDIILTPRKLMKLYSIVPDIIECINIGTEYKHVVGAICKYSNFGSLNDLVEVDKVINTSGCERNIYENTNRFTHSLILYIKRNSHWFSNIKMNILQQNGINTSLIEKKGDNVKESLIDMSGVVNLSSI
jgi:hypothetical protein